MRKIKKDRTHLTDLLFPVGQAFINTGIPSTGYTGFIRFLLLAIGLLIGAVPVVSAQSTTRVLSLTNLASKTKAEKGEAVTHTLILMNTGTTPVTNIVVRDSSSVGLRYVGASFSVPAGTTFSQGTPISTWSIPALNAGQRLSLTFQAIADSSGIMYSKATVPGDTAFACTSIPVKVCTGDVYSFQLTAPAGRSSYRWYKNDAVLTGQTSNILLISAPGSYSLAVDNTSGNCPDFSRCSFIVEEHPLPNFQASTLSATCTSGTPQPTGQIVLSSFGATDTFQYSEGSDFNPGASLSGQPGSIPAGGLIANNLPNPSSDKSYTIRVFNASGCYVDRTVTLKPSTCCTVAVDAVPGTCDPTTNTFSTTVVINLTNSVAGTLTVTDGLTSKAFTTTTSGSTSFTAVFTDLPSNGSSHTVVASLPGCSTAADTYTAPDACPTQLDIALTDPGFCQPATNSYAITGVLLLKNAVEGTATVVDGTVTATLSISAGATEVPYSLTGLPSGTANHTVSVTYAGKSASLTYTAPGSCAPAGPSSLALTKSVDKTKATIGDVLTYTLVLTNTGSTIATDVTVGLSTRPGLRYVTGSVTTPGGTTFTQGNPINSWTVGSLSAGASLSITFQAIVESGGVLYNTAYLPGDSVKTCTTVPIKVCAGSTYTYRLTAAPGRSVYHWYRNNVELVDQTTNSLVVTSPGTYSLATDGASGNCPDFGCCPFIVEEDSLPVFGARAIPATCVVNRVQPNGQLVLSQFDPAYTYQYSLGARFDASASLSGSPASIPAGGILVQTLASPAAIQPYTVRVYNGSGCYRDITVNLAPTLCTCPADGCAPFVVSQSKRGKRIGDLR